MLHSFQPDIARWPKAACFKRLAVPLDIYTIREAENFQLVKHSKYIKHSFQKSPLQDDAYSEEKEHSLQRLKKNSTQWHSLYLTLRSATCRGSEPILNLLLRVYLTIKGQGLWSILDFQWTHDSRLDRKSVKSCTQSILDMLNNYLYKSESL